MLGLDDHAQPSDRLRAIQRRARALSVRAARGAIELLEVDRSEDVAEAEQDLGATCRRLSEEAASRALMDRAGGPGPILSGGRGKL